MLSLPRATPETFTAAPLPLLTTRQRQRAAQWCDKAVDLGWIAPDEIHAALAEADPDQGIRSLSARALARGLPGRLSSNHLPYARRFKRDYLGPNLFSGWTRREMAEWASALTDAGLADASELADLARGGDSRGLAKALKAACGRWVQRIECRARKAGAPVLRTEASVFPGWALVEDYRTEAVPHGLCHITYHGLLYFDLRGFPNLVDPASVKALYAGLAEMLDVAAFVPPWALYEQWPALPMIEMREDELGFFIGANGLDNASEAELDAALEASDGEDWGADLTMAVERRKVQARPPAYLFPPRSRIGRSRWINDAPEGPVKAWARRARRFARSFDPETFQNVVAESVVDEGAEASLAMFVAPGLTGMESQVAENLHQEIMEIGDRPISLEIKASKLRQAEDFIAARIGVDALLAELMDVEAEIDRSKG